jgi:hypothetical protein
MRVGWGGGMDSLSRVMVATSTVVNQIPPCLCTHELMVTSFYSWFNRPGADTSETARNIISCQHNRSC